MSNGLELNLKRGDLCKANTADYRERYTQDGIEEVPRRLIHIKHGDILEAIKIITGMMNYWLFWVPEQNGFCILPIDYNWVIKL